MMWAWHAGDMGWGWFIIGPLLMLAFWGAVIWLVYALFAAPKRGDERHLSPREIAQRRLAADEIDEADFDNIIAKLKGGRS